MIEQFLNHISRHQLCKTNDKILLAVSGGMDSMVMLDLFVKAGYKPAVAHCNFQLRGNDSDLDEKLVQETCDRLKLSFHCNRFDTEGLAADSGNSIQVTARNLRYAFFDHLRDEAGYAYLATAHHLNDHLETVLLNLVRGTGIDGITGIPVKNGWIVRPMLFASRNDIEKYASDNGIAWREDASNQADDYQRNYIRHHVVPRLKALNPSLEETFESTSTRISAMASLAWQSLDSLFGSIISEKHGDIYIGKAELKKNANGAVFLWEYLKQFGFNYRQCIQLTGEHQSGKVFHSSCATITVDRNHYILQITKEKGTDSATINKGDREIILNDKLLRFKETSIDKFELVKSLQTAQLDFDRLHFPLLWRQWRAGDSIIPLGMNLRKKVSDMLIDNKIPLPEKGAVTVLESNGEIVWVVGLRINDHYKVTPQTRTVLIIECSHV